MIKHSGSIEDYLEAIFILEEKYNKVKAVQIADFLEISRPAVTKAIKILEKEELIFKDKTNIHLTEKGKDASKNVYEKHKTIKNFLLKIGVSEETAEKDCCKIEHCISDETFEKIKNLKG